MTISSRQLGLFLVLLCALTLTLAWIIERRQILSFRRELDAWGMPQPAADEAPASSTFVPPPVPDPAYDPAPAPPPPPAPEADNG